MKQKIWLPLCLALGLVGGACQWRDQPAATINGQVITVKSLTDEANALAATPAFATTYLGTNVSGSNDKTVAIDALKRLLEVRIRALVIGEELATRGITLTAEDLASTQVTIAASEPSFADVADAVRREIVRRQAVERRFRDVLEADGALKGLPGDAASFYQANKDNYSEVCLNGIVLNPTESDAAAAALALLNTGRPFSEVAPKYDPKAAQTGGDLGCGSLATLSPDIRDQLIAVPLDNVVGPLRTTSSIVLLAVYKRTPQAYADVASEVNTDWAGAKQAVMQAAFASWLSTTRLHAKVDPRFGHLTPSLTLSSEPVKPA